MSVAQLQCPGSRENAVQLTNEFTTSAGVGHPTNTGECRIFLDALDANGKSLHQLTLDPGQGVAWFTPPSGAVAIWAVCVNNCSGRGELTYDTPTS